MKVAQRDPLALDIKINVEKRCKVIHITRIKREDTLLSTDVRGDVECGYRCSRIYELI